MGLVSLFNNAYADGASGAPSGTAQYPSILNGYATRPPWKVAGVDYAVGIPSSVTLQDPWPGYPSTTVGTALASAFITQCGGSGNLSLTANKISINGNNASISGWDFSLHGGVQLELNGVIGTIIQNCNFEVGANGTVMLNGDVGATNNTTITCCSFNMHGLNDGFNAGAVNIRGNVTATYNLIQNSAADLWDQGGTGVTVQTLTRKYNVFKDAGQGAAGLHPDQLQFGGGTYTLDEEFNTYYQSTLGAAGGTQGICPDNTNLNGTTMAGASKIANNTIIALAGTSVNSQFQCNPGSGSATILIDSNYIDPSGDGAVYKFVNSNNTQTNNVNMVTGGALNS